MPVSLLTPIARDLGLTEGQAGQAISISGLFAVATSLLISTVIGRLDRDIVVTGMALLLADSGAPVALAPDVLALMTGALMTGRALPGVAINKAGLMPLLPMDRFKVDEWDRVIDVTIKGVLYGIAAALPRMQEQT